MSISQGGKVVLFAVIIFIVVAFAIYQTILLIKDIKSCKKKDDDDFKQ